MTTAQVEVITSVQRRRRWSRAEKERIVAAALVAGANASAVAREPGIHVSQLFRWRQELCERSQGAPTVQDSVVRRTREVRVCEWAVARLLPLAVAGRRFGDDLAGAPRLSARRHRLGHAAAYVASTSGWLFEIFIVL